MSYFVPRSMRSLVTQYDIVSRAEGRITRKNLVHFRKNLKQKSYRKIQKSYKNPKNL